MACDVLFTLLSAFGESASGRRRHNETSRSSVDKADRSQCDPAGVGLLRSCRHVVDDRDTKFCASFRSILADGEVEAIALPVRSPNLKTFAERWVRTVKEECLSKLILFGEGPLSRTLAEFSAHYHGERNHQGEGNHLLFPSGGLKFDNPVVTCRHRLGGLLKYYSRAA